MALNGAGILVGATISPTGGTATTFASAGIQNSVQTLNNNDDTDLRTRRQIVASTKSPSVLASAPNGYTQARNSVTIKWPQTLTNGKVSVDTMRIELSRDVETTQAEVLEYLKQGAQVLIDSDFLDYWYDLNLN